MVGVVGMARPAMVGVVGMARPAVVRLSVIRGGRRGSTGSCCAAFLVRPQDADTTGKYRALGCALRSISVKESRRLRHCASVAAEDTPHRRPITSWVDIFCSAHSSSDDPPQHSHRPLTGALGAHLHSVHGCPKTRTLTGMQPMSPLRIPTRSLWITLFLAACGSPEGMPSQAGETGGRGAAIGGTSADQTSTGGTRAAGGASTATTEDSSGGSGGSTATTKNDTTLAGGTTSSGGQQAGGTSANKSNTALVGGKTSSGGQQTGGTSVTKSNTALVGGTTGSGGQQTGGTSANKSNTALVGGKTSSGGQQTGGGGTTSLGGTSGQGTATTAGGTSGQGGTRPNTTGKQGERFPFPQNVRYPHGVQSTKVTNDFVKNWYENWKKNRLVACNGNLMPAADSSSISKVEAQGFAMVAVAYMGDKDVFDKLYNFYLSKTSSAGCGLSGWQTNCGGVQDSGAATDGDIDVASGLVVAHWQWPDAGYDAKAKTLLTNLRKMLVECSGKWAVYPGCGGGRPWGGCNETDISYYSPAFFRYFAKFSGDQAWSKLADDTQTIRDAAANATTGLVPDWQSVSGTPGAGSRSGNYAFDAIRAPYKQCLDYLWHGTPAALNWCKKISSWAYGIGVGQIKDGYQLNGTQTSNNHNMAAVGSLAVASMANTQEIADAFVAESAKLRDDYWYSSYLGNLYLLAMSGNMWNPEILGVE